MTTPVILSICGEPRNIQVTNPMHIVVLPKRCPVMPTKKTKGRKNA